MDDATILAFDTAGPYCSAALLQEGRITALAHEDMARGQAEHLVPLLENLLMQGQVAWSDLTRIGVGIGPGNFTGIRISVSAARGLALGLGIPAVGVSLFETTGRLSGNPLCAVPAPRDQFYVSDSDGPEEPRLLSALPEGPVSVSADFSVQDHVATIAQLAAAASPDAIERPAPLYVRAPDAAPPRDAAPTILP